MSARVRRIELDVSKVKDWGMSDRRWKNEGSLGGGFKRVCGEILFILVRVLLL